MAATSSAVADATRGSKVGPILVMDAIAASTSTGTVGLYERRRRTS